jgi:hypothetical protein
MPLPSSVRGEYSRKENFIQVAAGFGKSDMAPEQGGVSVNSKPFAFTCIFKRLQYNKITNFNIQ